MVWDIPKTSAKMRIRIMPTKSLGCCAVPRTPASPTIPIANLSHQYIHCFLVPRYLPSGKTRKTDTETSTELNESGKEGLLLR
jgi:hypothetical protein